MTLPDGSRGIRNSVRSSVDRRGVETSSSVMSADPDRSSCDSRTLLVIFPPGRSVGWGESVKSTGGNDFYFGVPTPSPSFSSTPPTHVQTHPPSFSLAHSSLGSFVVTHPTVRSHMSPRKSHSASSSSRGDHHHRRRHNPPDDDDNDEEEGSSEKKAPRKVATGTTSTRGKRKPSSSSSSSIVAAPPPRPLDPPPSARPEDDDEEEEGSLDVGACCLCHCSLDYSDRAAFFVQDRQEDYPPHFQPKSTSTQGPGEKPLEPAAEEEEKQPNNKDDDDDDNDDSSYYFRQQDPYLPVALYDPHNALVYCDDCNRLYHQKCHFVPILLLPRGSWTCLFCRSHPAQWQKKHWDRGHRRKPPPPSNQPTTPTIQQNQHEDTMKPSSRRRRAKTCTSPGRRRRNQAVPSTRDHDRADHQKEDDDDDNGQNPASEVAPQLHYSRMFQSPPNQQVREMELDWEAWSHTLKAAALRTELHQRLRQSYCPGQWSALKMAQAALDTYTSTSRNRLHFFAQPAAGPAQLTHGPPGKKSASTFRSSQEVADCLVRLYACQNNLRQALLNLDQVRQDTAATMSWPLLHQWIREYYHQQQQKPPPALASSDAKESQGQKENDFVQRVLFPFGLDHPPRRIPRTAEMQPTLIPSLLPRDSSAASTAKATVPDEIVVSSSKKSSHARNTTAQSTKNHPHKDSSSPTRKNHAHGHNDSAKTKGKARGDENDDDSGISLDDLTCCVCLKSDATDENDLILCDGVGCYRAYHMKCVKPEVTMATIEDSDDWFCPLCSTLADLVLLVQTEYMGDEWEQRRYAAQLDGQATVGSLKSWEVAQDVFPQAPADYQAARQLRDGQRNQATEELLVRVLGLDQQEDPLLNQGQNNGDEDDNIDEDKDFDLDSFQERRRKLREEGNDDGDEAAKKDGNDDDNDDDDEDDESIASSQATLVDMSSVELEIPRDELAALSEEDNDHVDEHQVDLENGVRRSRRFVEAHAEEASQDKDIGALDKANIINGKRNRTRVDYVLLNEAIFGELSEGEVAKIDDADEFQMKKRTKQSRGSDTDSQDADDEIDASGGERQQKGVKPKKHVARTNGDNESRKRPRRANRTRKMQPTEDDEGEQKTAKLSRATTTKNGAKEARTGRHSQRRRIAKKFV